MDVGRDNIQDLPGDPQVSGAHGTGNGRVGNVPGQPEMVWYPVSRMIGGSHLRAVLLPSVVLEGVVALLAAAEGSLLGDSSVVARAFLDYWSWHFAFLVVVPAALLVGMRASARAPLALGEIQAALGGSDEGAVAELGRRWEVVTLSRPLWSHPLVHAALGLVVVAGQQAAWSRDRGTAFCDLVYDGRLSLTGAYTALALFASCFAILQVVSRSIQVIRFVDTAFGDSNGGRLGSGGHYVVWDPAGLWGLRSVGSLLLLLHTLMLLLGALVAVSFAEKLKFFDGPSEALASAPLSVVLFGLMFLLVVPYLVFAPLFRIHTSLSRFRIGRLREIGRQMARLEGNALGQTAGGWRECQDGPDYGLLEKLRQTYLGMGTWPVNVLGVLYLGASQVSSMAAALLAAVAAMNKLAST
jgi:hypothetical protein